MREQPSNHADRASIYTLSPEIGGERVFLSALSTRLGIPLRYLWDPIEHVPLIQLKSVAHRFLRPLLASKALRRFRDPIGVVYKFILVSKAVIPEDIVLVSSSFIPIPRGKYVIALIMTPPRIATIERSEWLERIRRRSYIQYIGARGFLMVYTRVYINSLKNASVVITISDEVKLRLQKLCNRNSERIYLFVAPNEFARVDRDRVFIWVSRVVRAKRLEFAVHAFEKFQQECTGFRLIVFGSITNDVEREEDNAYLSEIISYVNMRGLAVEFHIDVDRATILRYYSRAYACLFTALNEDLGLVPLEAMAAENPVIAVREGGPLETVLDGVTGFLVGDEDEMAEKMLYLVRNPGVAKEMGRRGRAHVCENFSDDTLLERYRSLLEGRGHATTQTGPSSPQRDVPFLQ